MTNETTDTQVVIAWAGPTGLMLAREPRLGGVEVLVLERLPEPRTVESRAGGLPIRTMETLDQRGVLEPFLERGRRRPSVHFAGIPLDLSAVATRHPFLLIITQSEVERILAERTVESGAQIRRGAELAGFTQDETGVTVDLTDGLRVRGLPRRLRRRPQHRTPGRANRLSRPSGNDDRHARRRPSG